MKVINEARNRILLLKGKPQKGSKTKRKSWKTSCLSCHQRLSFFFFFPYSCSIVLLTQLLEC